MQLISVYFSNGTSKGSNNSQPLVQWSEVPGHVGLMYCMTQSTNNPVVLMIKPDAMLVQEIKVVPAKAKVIENIFSMNSLKMQIYF